MVASPPRWCCWRATGNSVTLACQVLIYPMLVPPAHSIDAVAPDPRTGHYIWTRASNNYCWSAFLGGVAPDARDTWRASLRISSVLPPAFLVVGELDLFVHDNLAYAGRLLHRGGCPVEAHLYPGAIHGFDRAVDAAVSVRYTRELVAFIQPAPGLRGPYGAAGCVALVLGTSRDHRRPIVLDGAQRGGGDTSIASGALWSPIGSPGGSPADRAASTPSGPAAFS